MSHEKSQNLFLMVAEIEMEGGGRGGTKQDSSLKLTAC